MKKWILVVILLAGLGALGWGVYIRLSEAKLEERKRGRPAVAVKVVDVGRGMMEDIGSFTGSLLPKSQFVVSPKISGRLKKLEVNIGDKVHNGDLIATLDDAEYAQEVEQVRASLDVANASLEEANSDVAVAFSELDRIRKLREKNISSQSELDVAEARYKAAIARQKVNTALVNQRKAALRAAEIRLGYSAVRATWEEADDTPRVVGERFVDEGALLKENQPIVSILENHVMIGVVYVIERDDHKVSIGQEATVTTDGQPDAVFEGRIVRIAPLLVETSGRTRVEIEIPNPVVETPEPKRLLKTGNFIVARVLLDTQDNVTIVPADALVKRSEKEGLFLADPETGKARFVPLKTGIRDRQNVEVLEPADLAGQVIVLGQHLLENGSDIIIVAAGAEPRKPEKVDQKSVPDAAPPPADNTGTRP